MESFLLRAKQTCWKGLIVWNWVLVKNMNMHACDRRTSIQSRIAGYIFKVQTKVLEGSFKVDFHYPHMKAKDTSDAFWLNKAGLSSIDKVLAAVCTFTLRSCTLLKTYCNLSNSLCKTLHNLCSLVNSWDISVHRMCYEENRAKMKMILKSCIWML